MIRGHLRPIPKSNRPRAVLRVLSLGLFFCDRPNLTPNDKKLAVKTLCHPERSETKSKDLNYELSYDYCIGKDTCNNTGVLLSSSKDIFISLKMFRLRLRLRST